MSNKEEFLLNFTKEEISHSPEQADPLFGITLSEYEGKLNIAFNELEEINEEDPTQSYIYSQPEFETVISKEQIPTLIAALQKFVGDKP